ncbi:MAG: GAF domain-containing protein [Pseudomonadota bacterium]
MKTPAKHPQEEARLITLFDYKILDTQAEQSFDDLTRLASYVFQTPIALISLIDNYRQWFKSAVGLQAKDTPRELAFCAHAILQKDFFVIENALTDPRFSDNPLVTHAPNVTFYAGAPLIAPNGLPLGTLCVIDTKPRTADPKQLEALKALSHQVISQMELRIKLLQIEAQHQALNKAHLETERALKSKTIFLYTFSYDFYEQINGIVELSGAIKNTPFIEEQSSLNELIYSLSHSLLDVSHDALDYSRIEANAVQIMNASFSLQETLSTIERILHPLAESKALSFNILIADDVPDTLTGDIKRLEQILRCLGQEAIRFSKQGEICIEISRADNQIEFLITDSGDAIAPQFWTDLFELHTEVETSFTYPAANATQRGQTLGLSRATSKKLAQLMKGDLMLIKSTIESTQFCLSLPLIKDLSRSF